MLIETLESLGMKQAYIHHPLTSYLQKPAEKMWEEMRQTAEENGCGRILLSHEAIFCEAYRTFRGLSYVPEPEEQKKVMNRFHERLSALVDIGKNDVSSVVYLRDKESYLDSQYNQYIKEPWYEENPELPVFEEFVKKQPVTLNYEQPLSLIKKIYGKDHVRTERYEEVDNLYNSFLQSIPELPSDIWKELQMPNERVNQSLSYDAVAFKRDVLPPAFARNTRIQKVLEEYSASHPDEKKYTWGKEGKNTLYTGLTEEKIVEIMEYVTDKVSQM
jgi:hypothetical protein